MQLINLCRLCLREEGEFYKLFNDCGKENALVNELNAILNFKLIKEEHFPESICSNCYKINAFFKEFRDNCSRVNDYIKGKLDSQKVTSLGVTIKTEKTDNTENISDENVSNTKDDEGRAPSGGEIPYPVALLSLTYSDNLEPLRSNFHDRRNKRVDISDNINTEKESQSTDTTKVSSKKGANDGSKVLQESEVDDIPQELRAMVKTEVFDDESEVQNDNYERDIDENVRSEVSAGEDLFSSELNSITNDEDIQDSEINFLDGNQVNDEIDRAVNVINKTTGGCEESNELSRKRKCVVQDSENSQKRTKVTDHHSLSSSAIQGNHVVKQEEIDIYEPPLEEELNNYDSLDVEDLADEAYPSDCGDSEQSLSSISEDEDSASSCSSRSSDESDEETEMLLLLAMLM